MKSKLFSNVLFASLMIFLTSGVLLAQNTMGNEVPYALPSNACELCAPQIGSISVYNLPNCLAKGFSANTGGYGRCEQIEVIWATNDDFATFSFSGGSNQFALITFSGPGVYQVCAMVRYGIDLNNDGRIDGDEICTSPQFCTRVTVCP